MLEDTTLLNCLCLPSENKSNFKKSLYSLSSKYVPFRVDPFAEEGWLTEKQAVNYLNFFPLYDWQRIY